MAGAHQSLVYSFKSCPSTRRGPGGGGAEEPQGSESCLSCIYTTFILLVSVILLNFYSVGECDLLVPVFH